MVGRAGVKGQNLKESLPLLRWNDRQQMVGTVDSQAMFDGVVGKGAGGVRVAVKEWRVRLYVVDWRAVHQILPRR